MTDPDRARAALAGLATGEFATQAEPEPPSGAADRPTDAQPTGGQSTGDYRAVVERAAAATEELSAAAAFVEEVGLDDLERAVERAEREVSGVAADGRRALDAFRRYREVAGERGER
ncbi:hypothetical protein [Haloarcula litorea]|uniref:hypothetical protein n=1 Tax=Haloarcula litorea TaxID=3032579 RepID=UPI0023E7718C|nr:hypothetical protein [Halomicroarcula sp. GDY20]